MATQFKFRLQPVLKHRQRIEDRRQIELAQAQGVCRREEAELDALQTREAHTMDVLTQQELPGRLDVEAVRHSLAYLELLAEDIDRQTAVVADAQQQVELKRQETVRAMQDRQVLEKLRARGLQRWRQAVDRDEARALDELAVTRYRPPHLSDE